MSDKTNVEWTRSASGPGASWNPFRGCDPVSPGCAHCYAAAVALRFSGIGMAFEGMAVRTARGSAQWTGVVRVIEDKMQEPLRWKRPRRIFALGSNPVASLSNAADAYYVAKDHRGKGGDWDVWPPYLRVREYADTFDTVAA